MEAPLFSVAYKSLKMNENDKLHFRICAQNSWMNSSEVPVRDAGWEPGPAACAFAAQGGPEQLTHSRI